MPVPVNRQRVYLREACQRISQPVRAKQQRALLVRGHRWFEDLLDPCAPEHARHRERDAVVGVVRPENGAEWLTQVLELTFGQDIRSRGSGGFNVMLSQASALGVHNSRFRVGFLSLDHARDEIRVRGLSRTIADSTSMGRAMNASA